VVALMSDRLKWGILSTGRIAHWFATALAASRTGRLVAVGSRTREAAGKFAAEFNGIRAHDSYDALLADPAVQAVYIGTPHDSHAELCIRAARAGKHILCEKPLALNRADAARAVAAAREHRVFLMEAFMYRCHPQTARLAELVRGGAIGELRLVSAVFCFNRPVNPALRLYNRALGGGAILDIGCYPVSISRLVAGAALGQPFAEPVEFHGTGRVHPVAQVDEQAAATLKFPDGALAQLACGTTTAKEIAVRIYGTDGIIQLPVPFHPGFPAEGPGRIIIHRPGAAAEEIPVEPVADLYANEADTVGDAIARGETESAVMSHADSLGNMAVLDAWRAAVGVRYAGET
jgi:predicted dehydrogenase